MRFTNRLRISRAMVLGFFVFAIASAAQDKPKTNFKWTPGPTFIRISPGVADKLLIKRVEPKFSPQLLRQFSGSKVELGIRIGPKGRVTEIVPISGPRELAEEAAAAVLQWCYKPYLINGEPTLVESKISFDLASAMPRAPNKPLKMSDGLEVIESHPPQYPARVLASGPVVLKFIVGKDGAVHNITVVKGHPALVQSAIDAVKSWKYKPYLLNGEPVEVETQAVINFQR